MTFQKALEEDFINLKKISTTLRIDDDILCILKKKASEKKIPYQTLINNLLREQCGLY